MSLTNNRISTVIATDVLAEVKNHFAKINALLPFLTGLTAEERQTMPKIDQANKVFVGDAIKGMMQHPSFLPAYLNVEELQKDFTLYNQLDELASLAAALSEKLSDTQMLAGSEAYITSLSAYRMFEGAAKAGMAGADSVYDELKQRFAGQGGSGEKPATPTS
jgi:hypothetical protein